MGARIIPTTPAGRSRSEPAHLISVDQLSAIDLRQLLDEAGRLADGGEVAPQRFSATLLFLQPSLRTRLSFAEATYRMGGAAHVVSRTRDIAFSDAAESLGDTVRVASGLSQLIVVRTHGILADQIGATQAPVINAGDDLEHPTQTLVDLLAFERMCGPIENLTIGVCGDLQMRVARSLMKGLTLLPPKRLRLMAPHSRRGDSEQLLAPIRSRVEWSEGGSWEGLDVLYLTGLPPHGKTDVLEEQQRAPYSFTETNADRLPAHARVFSPMPVIDEISSLARADPRVAIFAQSDCGVAVRMAALSHVLGLRG